MVAGSLASDLDVLPGLWDPAVSLVLHRFPTHSLLGGLALALVLAGVIRGIGGGSYRPLAALVYLGPQGGESRVVEFRELAFQDHPFGGPMVLRVRVDPSGAVQAVEFDHRL